MNALEARIREIIATSGPLTIGQYMAMCLGDPEHGYYMQRPPFGAEGDFTTAPEISQIFGELIGLWAADYWQRMGAPDPVILAEFGPGRGTLMQDALRAAHALPAFREAARPWLIETSPRLRAVQQQALAGEKVQWGQSLADLPPGPMIAIANEFFDALPVRQFIRLADGWHERLVGIQGDHLVFITSPRADQNIPELLAEAHLSAAEGEIAEICPDAQRIAAEIAARLQRQDGAMLFLDYGPARSATGDSLQALRDHRFHDPLADPGEADITAHVDFQRLLESARLRGGRTAGPLTQGEFLSRLGLHQRAGVLAHQNPARQKEIMEGAKRLSAPGEMGTLFKAAAIFRQDGPVPAGFTEAECLP